MVRCFLIRSSVKCSSTGSERRDRNTGPVMIRPIARVARGRGRNSRGGRSCARVLRGVVVRYVFHFYVVSGHYAGWHVVVSVPGRVARGGQDYRSFMLEGAFLDAS